MKLRREISALARAAALALAGAAPLGAQTTPIVPAHWFQLREGPPSAFTRPYGAGLALPFTEDPALDYVGLADTEAVLWMNLAVHDARVSLGVHGTDLAAQADFRPGGAQAIVLTTSTGLRRYWYEDGVLLGDTLGGAAWNGALAVAAARLGPDLRTDFAGIGADAREVLRLAQGPNGAFTPLPSFSLPLPARQLEVLDLDDAALGDGVDELALRFDRNVAVYTAAGALRMALTTPEPTVTLSRLHDGVAGVDRLAVLTADGQGKQTLRIYDGAGQQLLAWPLTTQTDPYRAVRCTPADLDGLGDVDELLLSLTSHGFPLRLSFQDLVSPPTAAPMSLPIEGMEGPSPFNRADLAVGDLDADGDLDPVYPCMASDDLVVYRGDAVDHRPMIPSLVDGSYDGAGTLSVTWDLPVSPPPGAQHFQLRVWIKRGHAEELFWQEIESPTPYFEQLVPIGAATSHSATIALGADQAYWEAGDLMLYCAARTVPGDGLGAVTGSAPTAVHVLAGQMATLELIHAETPWAAAAELPTLFSGQPHGGSGAYILKIVLPHPPNDPPEDP